MFEWDRRQQDEAMHAVELRSVHAHSVHQAMLPVLRMLNLALTRAPTAILSSQKARRELARSYASEAAEFRPRRDMESEPKKRLTTRRIDASESPERVVLSTKERPHDPSQ